MSFQVTHFFSAFPLISSCSDLVFATLNRNFCFTSLLLCLCAYSLAAERLKLLNITLSLRLSGGKTILRDHLIEIKNEAIGGHDVIVDLDECALRARKYVWGDKERLLILVLRSGLI